MKIFLCLETREFFSLTWVFWVASGAATEPGQGDKWNFRSFSSSPSYVFNDKNPNVDCSNVWGIGVSWKRIDMFWMSPWNVLTCRKHQLLCSLQSFDYRVIPKTDRFRYTPFDSSFNNLILFIEKRKFVNEREMKFPFHILCSEMNNIKTGLWFVFGSAGSIA